jgi:hypothetical protein
VLSHEADIVLPTFINEETEKWTMKPKSYSKFWCPD